MAKQYLIPGYGFIDEAGSAEYLIPGYGFFNADEVGAFDVSSIIAAPSVGGTPDIGTSVQAEPGAEPSIKGTPGIEPS